MLYSLKGKKEDPRNYRSVSLTSVPGKVMEQNILRAVTKSSDQKQPEWVYKGQVLPD